MSYLSLLCFQVYRPANTLLRGYVSEHSFRFAVVMPSDSICLPLSQTSRCECRGYFLRWCLWMNVCRRAGVVSVRYHLGSLWKSMKRAVVSRCDKLLVKPGTNRGKAKIRPIREWSRNGWNFPCELPWCCAVLLSCCPAVLLFCPGVVVSVLASSVG